MLVVAINEFSDLALEVSDRVEGAAADGLVADQCELALDLIEPGTGGRSEVHVEARPARRPDSNLGMFVSGVVITDQMHIEVLGNMCLDVAQQGEKLLMPVTRFALVSTLPLAISRAAKSVVVPLSNVVVGDALDVAQAPVLISSAILSSLVLRGRPGLSSL